MKKLLQTLLGTLVLGLGLANAGFTQEPVKIGMVTTLSTGGGYLGQDVRDGFLLAVEEEDGKLGGVPVEVLVEDDGRNPVNGRQIVKRFLDRDRISILTGVIFSNISPVVAPMALKDGIFYISPNSAPSTFAGKECHENYFVVSWQNDTLHEAAGMGATELGYKKALLLAPNYQAGKDALAGFKRFFKGEVIDEIYVKLGQNDYAAEIARIRAAKPEMVFQFLPGGMGINFLKQYSQAGLMKDSAMVVSGFSADIKILNAIGDAGSGIISTSQWNHDLDNAANQQFLLGFRNKFEREPTLYASQGYDTAKLIASALKATGGKVLEDKAGFREALKAAKFASVRGNFRFASNQHPIHDLYIREVVKNNGQMQNRILRKVATDHQDAYVQECGLR